MKVFAALVAVLVGLASQTAYACAGCSNPNLPDTGRVSGVLLRPGRLDLRLASTATTLHVVHEARCPDLGAICEERDEPAQLHDQRLNILELRLAMSYAVDESLALELQLPVRATQTSIVYRRLDGTVFTPSYANIHHRNETLFGVADPIVDARMVMRAGPLFVGAFVGMSLPLGRIERDPFALGEQGREHQHIQFGTGTFNPVLGLDAALRVSELTATAYGQLFLPLYENRYGYRAGTRASVGTALRLPLAPFTFALTSDGLFEDTERWRGVVQQDGNLGRTDVLLGGSAAALLGGREVALAIRVPVYSHIVRRTDERAELDYPAIVSLSVATSFSG